MMNTHVSRAVSLRRGSLTGPSAKFALRIWWFDGVPGKELRFREGGRCDDQIHLPRRRTSGSHIGVGLAPSVNRGIAFVPPREAEEPRTTAASSVWVKSELIPRFANAESRSPFDE